MGGVTSYGRAPDEKQFVDCVPPLVVMVGRERRVWDFILHTCDLPVENPCLACGYRDCPAHEPGHYYSAGCPSCG
jgi:hypothetical protein